MISQLIFLQVVLIFPKCGSFAAIWKLFGGAGVDDISAIKPKNVHPIALKLKGKYNVAIIRD